MTRGPALRTLSSESDCGSQRLAGVAAAIADSGEPKLIITLDPQMALKVARCADPVTSSAVMGRLAEHGHQPTILPTVDPGPSFLRHTTLRERGMARNQLDAQRTF